MVQLSSRIYAIETLEGFENLAGKANINEVPVTIHINALF